MDFGRKQGFFPCILKFDFLLLTFCSKFSFNIIKNEVETSSKRNKQVALRNTVPMRLQRVTKWTLQHIAVDLPSQSTMQVFTHYKGLHSAQWENSNNNEPSDITQLPHHLVEKCCSLSFPVGEMKLHNCFLPLENSCWCPSDQVWRLFLLMSQKLWIQSAHIECF